MKSFDLNAIKTFCVQHFEKFLFGVVILGLVVLTYGATTVQTVEFTPEELTEATQLARKDIAKTEPKVFLASNNIEAKPYGGFNEIPVEERFYQWDNHFYPPLFPPPPRRGEPEVYGVRDLLANANHGRFNIMGRPMAVGGQPAPLGGQLSDIVRGRRWVVVTGLLPTKEQMEAYEQAFPYAKRDPRRDRPMYYYYMVERAELAIGGEGGEPQWAQIDPGRRLWDVFQSWRPATEAVHQMYLPRRYHQFVSMVFPLGPYVKGIWGDEVAHPPEIPLIIDMPKPQRQPRSPFMGQYPGILGPPTESEGEKEEPGQGEGKTEPGTPGESPFPGAPPFFGPPGGPGGPGGPAGPAGPAGRPFAGGPTPFGPGGPFGGGGSPYGGPGMSMPYAGSTMPGGPGMYSSDMEYGGDQETDYGDYSSDYSEYGNYGDYQSEMGGPSGMAMRTERMPDFQLFRFFDFNVEPGKRYQYRVKLYLINPNYKLSSQELEREELGANWWVETDFSEASNVIEVPRDSRLLAGTVDPDRLTSVPRGSPLLPGSMDPEFIGGQQADVYAVTFEEQGGLENGNEFTVARGQWANLEGTLAKETTQSGRYGFGSDSAGQYPGYPTSADAGMYGDMQPTGTTSSRPGTDEAEEEKVQHDTNMIVLDIAGGNRLHRGGDEELTEPGMLLLLDPDGNLMVRDELEDLDEASPYHVPEEEKKPRRKTREKERRGPQGSEEYYDMMNEEGDYYGFEDDGGRSSRRSRASRRRTRGSYGSSPTYSEDN